MDGIKEIKIFNNFVYDTPENRDKGIFICILLNIKNNSNEKYF